MFELPLNYYRMQDIAKYSEQPQKYHVYKSGKNKGKIKVIKAQPAKQGLVPVSAKTIWCWVREGKFPKPIRLSANVTVWKAEDIHQWISNKEAGDN